MQKNYIQQKSRVSKKKSKLLTWINASIVVCLAFSLVYYVAGINDLTVKGFDLQEKKVQVRALALESENYQDIAIAKESLTNMESRINDLDLVAVDNITYITVGDTTVAKK
jgi:cell division protein FtsB